MEHLLFAGYLIVFAWLVTKVRFFTRSGLTRAQLVIAFLLKVMAGIFYGWVGVYYGDMARMVDTWYFHYQSLSETKLLLTHPAQYISGIWSNDSGSYAGFLGGEASWWNELDRNFILKLMGVFNAASFGYYYINVIFYSFLTLFGPIALYRVFNDWFSKKQMPVLLAVLFIPSFIYWTSGLHKEGLIFNCIAFIIYAFYFALKMGRFSAGKGLGVLLSLLLLLVLRNYIVLVMLPALIAWVAAHKFGAKPVVTYSVIYLFFAVLFFAAPYISSNLDFPGAVVEKQRQFSQLKGYSEMPVQKLEPTLRSFVANAPQAINLSLIRPYFSDIRHLLSMAAALEINGLLFLFLIYILRNGKNTHHDPFSLFCLFFSLSVLVVIGYTVNFMGAIVRYRSIVLPLLFVPVIVRFPWTVLGRYLFNGRNKDNMLNS